MIGTEALAITYGLGCAITWGAGDFSGGFATKKGNVLLVILFSQLIGITMLLGLALAFSETIPPFSHLLWGMMGGLFGTMGMMALYPALANGTMSVVAPVAAVINAVIPIGFAFVFEGLPGSTRLIGFLIALVAVWVLSSFQGQNGNGKRDIHLAVIAGLGFGLFFVCIDRASESSVFWPLVAARLASITMLSLMVLSGKRKRSIGGYGFVFIALTGILDSLGNAFFALAAQQGRLDVAAVLGALYPVSTVFLAWLVLKERLQRRQWIGVVAAAFALVMIAM